MNKMRQNTGVVLWILVIAFGVIWVLQDTGALDQVGRQGGNRSVATVNGEEISYDQFTQMLQQYRQQYQDRTGQSVPAQVEDQYRDQVYNSLVNNELREQQMNELGIEVARSEIVQMVLGENPDPFIRQQFGNEQGQIDRAMLQQVINNPEARQDWLQIEEYLSRKRRQQKMNALITSAARVTEQDVVNEYIRRNTSVDAEFVALRYAAVSNDSVSVTDSDLRSFYEEHREEFEQPRTYSVEYVSYSKRPTSEDTTRILETLEKLKDNFATAEDDSAFIAQNASTTPYTPEFMTRADLDSVRASRLWDNPQAGKVVGPYVAQQEAHLTKIIDVREGEEPAVRARHILLQAPQNDEQAREEALQEARDLLQRIRQGESFADLARQYSDDDATASAGGDLGWTGPGSMVEPFQEAAYEARIGQVVGPVETQYGVHLIEVLGRESTELKIADLTRQFRPQVATITNLQENARDLQYYASQSGNFQSEAQNQNKSVQEIRVQEGQQSIPNLGRSARVMAFLEEAEEGAISEVLELDEQFLVMHVTGIQEAGYRSFEEVRSEIRPRVLTQKKREVQVRRLQRAYENNTFEQLPEALGVELRSATDVTRSTRVIPTLGQAPKFVGTVLGLGEGETSPVVEGETGAFVARVTSRTEPNPGQITQTQRQSIRQSITRQRQQQLSSEWIAALRESADIVDNRNQFLRQQR